jgi:hypothetical protein
MARQPFAGAVHQLATAGLGFLQDGGDVGIVVVEHFAQQEGGALLGFEALQQQQVGEGHIAMLLQQRLRRRRQAGLAVQVDLGGRFGQVHQGFRQPVADVVLALLLQLAQAIDAQPRHHRHQPGLGRFQLLPVLGMPAQPGVLQHVFGIAARPACGRPRRTGAAGDG